MTDQIRIGDNGELESVPVTWDGEPLYSPTTVQEGLFASEAFQQMPGQMAMKSREDWTPEDWAAHDRFMGACHDGRDIS